MQQKGYSRRDFLQFCATAATVAGFGKSGVAQVVSAFEKKEKPRSSGCTSRNAPAAANLLFAHRTHRADALLDVLSLNYTEL